MNKDNASSGFTMIEVLIVLTVLSIFLYLGGISIHSLWNTMEKKVFISQLEADLYYAQTYAISQQTPVVVEFYPLYERYKAKSIRSNYVLFDRQLPKSIDMLNGGTIQSYAISTDGSITKFGTLNFRNEKQIISLIFNIGVGRFRIEQ